MDTGADVLPDLAGSLVDRRELARTQGSVLEGFGDDAVAHAERALEIREAHDEKIVSVSSPDCTTWAPGASSSSSRATVTNARVSCPGSKELGSAVHSPASLT